MRNYRHKDFRRAFDALPVQVRVDARKAYRQFASDPSHPGLEFKRLQGSRHLYSIRVGLHYRAVAVRSHDEVVWLWIGSHADYDQFLRSL